jgi:hypothetical protein
LQDLFDRSIGNNNNFLLPALEDTGERTLIFTKYVPTLFPIWPRTDKIPLDCVPLLKSMTIRDGLTLIEGLAILQASGKPGGATAGGT